MNVDRTGEICDCEANGTPVVGLVNITLVIEVTVLCITDEAGVVDDAGV